MVCDFDNEPGEIDVFLNSSTPTIFISLRTADGLSTIQIPLDNVGYLADKLLWAFHVKCDQMQMR